MLTARRGVTAVFLAFGVFQGTWVSRIPYIAQHLGLDTAHLSVALLCAPIGQVLAAQLVSRLIVRWSSVTVGRAAVGAAGVSLVLPGLAFNLGSLAVALGLFGLTMGTLDIVMNAQGVTVERRYARPIMSGLHGMFSVGAFAGAGLGALATHFGVAPTPHFAIVAIAGGVVGEAGARRMLGRSADRPPVEEAAAGAPPDAPARLLRQPFLLVLGAVAFCAFFAEGAVENWSGIYLHETLGSSLATAPYGAAACGIGMAIGRFRGDWLIARWGRPRTLEACAGLAGVGMVLTLAAGSPGAAVAGYGLFGLGLSTLVPIAFTLAGSVPGAAPAWAISRVTTLGFVGLFAAPPVVGLLASATDLRLALGVLAALVCVVLPLRVAARRMGARRRAAPAPV